MKTEKKLSLGYWICTVLFALPMLWSALQYFIEAPRMMQTMAHLGYPVYFAKILGVAKVLGVFALLYPAFPRLKEWAFAGFTFDLLGAIASHLAVGDGAMVAAVPFAFLVVLGLAYACFRKLGMPSSRWRRSQRGAPWGVPA